MTGQQQTYRGSSAAQRAVVGGHGARAGRHAVGSERNQSAAACPSAVRWTSPLVRARSVKIWKKAGAPGATNQTLPTRQRFCPNRTDRAGRPEVKDAPGGPPKPIGPPTAYLTVGSRLHRVSTIC
jgi:hypothetical protein